MREPTKTFTYDSVFGTDTTQADVYNETARPIVDAVLEGYNGKREREGSSFISYFLPFYRYYICLWSDRHW